MHFEPPPCRCNFDVFLGSRRNDADRDLVRLREEQENVYFGDAAIRDDFL